VVKKGILLALGLFVCIMEFRLLLLTWFEKIFSKMYLTNENALCESCLEISVLRGCMVEEITTM
jgi:hypothetical protein